MSLGIIVNPLLPFYFEFSTDLLVMEILIVGAAQLGLGIGMLKAKLWSWIFAVFFLVAFMALNIIGLLNSLSYPIGNGLSVILFLLVTILAPLIILSYLFKPSVRNYFKSQHLGPPPNNIIIMASMDIAFLDTVNRATLTYLGRN